MSKFNRYFRTALAGLMLVLGALTVFTDQGLKPLWSSLAVPVVGIVGVWLGGKARLRHREV